jgi:hypothetical protein
LVLVRIGAGFAFGLSDGEAMPAGMSSRAIGVTGAMISFQPHLAQPPNLGRGGCAMMTGLHVILDNYAAHKHPKVSAWLGRHQRFAFHFTPTSCSWLNAVEGFFAKLSKRRLKRGIFHSLVDLQAAINRFLAETNQMPKPFTWTGDPAKIIAAVKRGHQALDSIH